MSEIQKYVHDHAAQITPRVMQKLLHELPMLKVEFTQINAPKYPHLVDQLEFLADVVEDFAEGAYLDIPYFVAAEAAFALIYCHQKIDIIPNFTEAGYADNSSIVRTIIIENERVLSSYAKAQGLDWSTVTIKP